MKRAPIGIAIVALAALAVWLGTRTGGGDDGTLSASGTVEATDADLGFQAAGRVAEVTVREGARVEAGQELARLDQRETRAGVEAARAALAAAEARLADLLSGARPQEIATAEAGYRSAVERATEAQREADRSRTLHAGGAVSRQALDRAESSLAVARAAATQAAEQLALVREGPRVESVRAHEAGVRAALADLERMAAVLANGVVTAPFGGVVTTRHREPGEAVGPGTPVLTLLDPDDRWVRIYVREDRIGRVHLGQRATIRSDTYPDRTYAGEVVHVGDEAEFTPRNVQTTEERIKLVYPVKVRVTSDPDFELKPGVPADVTLEEIGT